MGLRDNLNRKPSIFPLKKRGFHWQLFVTSGPRSLLAKHHQLVPHCNGAVAWPRPRRTRDPFERSLLRRGWWWCRTTPRRMAGTAEKVWENLGKNGCCGLFHVIAPYFLIYLMGYMHECAWNCEWNGDLGKMMTNDGILRYCTQFWDRPEPCEFFTHFPG
jgi:hypothetical protein